MSAPSLGQIAGVSAQLSYGCLPGRAQVPVLHTEIEDPAVNDGAVVLVQGPRAVAVEPNRDSGQKPGERGEHPKPVRQQVRGDARQLGPQVAVAAGPAEKLTQDQQGPPVAEKIERRGDGAVLAVRACCHGPSRAQSPRAAPLTPFEGGAMPHAACPHAGTPPGGTNRRPTSLALLHQLNKFLVL